MVSAQSLEEEYLNRLYNFGKEHRDIVSGLFKIVDEEVKKRVKAMEMKSPDDVSAVFDEMNEIWNAFRSRLSRRSLMFRIPGNRIPCLEKLYLERDPEFFARWLSFTIGAR